MLLEGLNILRFDNNGSNNTHESGPNEESNDSSNDFSEAVFEQGHMTDRITSTRKNSELT